MGTDDRGWQSPKGKTDQEQVRNKAQHQGDPRGETSKKGRQPGSTAMERARQRKTALSQHPDKSKGPFNPCIDLEGEKVHGHRRY